MARGPCVCFGGSIFNIITFAGFTAYRGRAFRRRRFQKAALPLPVVNRMCVAIEQGFDLEPISDPKVGMGFRRCARWAPQALALLATGKVLRWAWRLKWWRSAGAALTQSATGPAGRWQIPHHHSLQFFQTVRGATTVQKCEYFDCSHRGYPKNTRCLNGRNVYKFQL